MARTVPVNIYLGTLTTDRMRGIAFIGASALLLLAACKKDPDISTGNVAPYYNGVPTVVVQNYVNRLFIDLIGREPLDVEMSAETSALESAKLSTDQRIALVNKLMTNTDYIAGDSSYKQAYYQRQYELFKARCLEGASDAIFDQYIGMAQQAAFADSLAGDSVGYQLAKHEVDKLKAVKYVRIEYRNGIIDIREVFRRMLYNQVYDQINMNTFNFVNASFDDLYMRYPTASEFTTAYDMVDTNTPVVLFGQPGQNKADYVTIVTHNNEFHEDMIRWCYHTFLGRDATTYETYQALGDFIATRDLQRVERNILIGNEYANFP